MTIRNLLCASVAFLWFCGMGYADELPLPKDVPSPVEPFEFTIGTQLIKVQVFDTSRSVDQIRAFYQKALPKRGWRITAVPWLAEMQPQLEEFKRVLQEHRAEIEQDPKLQEQVARVNTAGMEEATRQLLYAVRGSEHLLLNFQPESSGALVFAHRWQGTSQAFLGLAEEEMEPTASVLGADGPGGTPTVSDPALTTALGRTGPADMTLAGFGADEQTGLLGTTSPCCSGEAVPESLRRLPSSIPQYPNARLLSTAEPPTRGDRHMSFEIYLSQDSVEQVAEYYRKHMPNSGWTMMDGVSEQGGPLQQAMGLPQYQLNMRVLSFQNDRGICGIAVAENLSDPSSFVSELNTPLPPETQESATQPPQLPAAGTERTGIVVVYLESPSLMELLKGPAAYAPPALALPHKR